MSLIGFEGLESRAAGGLRMGLGRQSPLDARVIAGVRGRGEAVVRRRCGACVRSFFAVASWLSTESLGEPSPLNPVLSVSLTAIVP